ncbi:hypothetical protein LBMAG26_17940 [Bacteroidota bacterium]|nr:hypothetical protein LBMAG26_17940 [Bacteroidota bacterium]
MNGTHHRLLLLDKVSSRVFIKSTTLLSQFLISGKVNQVDYSPGQRDEYHHRYTYDADNRIVQVETSKDAILWDKDANYQYYKHGPLSRAELGDLKVQGLD